jgi:hypothetical protein
MVAPNKFFTRSRIVGLVAAAAASVGVTSGLYVTRETLGFESDQRTVDAMNKMIQTARKAYETVGRVPEAMAEAGSEDIRYLPLSEAAIELCSEFNWGDVGEVGEAGSVLRLAFGPSDFLWYDGPPEGLLHHIGYRTRERGRNCFVMDMRCDGYGIPVASEDEVQCVSDRRLEEAGKDSVQR